MLDEKNCPTIINYQNNCQCHSYCKPIGKHNQLTCSLSPGTDCFADVTDIEHGWSLHIVPFFFGERVHTTQIKNACLLKECLLGLLLKYIHVYGSFHQVGALFVMVSIVTAVSLIISAHSQFFKLE